MSADIKINKEKKQLELYLNGELLQVIKGEEASSFIKKASKEITAKSFIFDKSFKIFSKGEIEESIDDIENLKGLEFAITLYVRCFPEAHVELSLITDNESDCRYFELLDDNFTYDKMYAGEVNNQELIACLSEEIIDHILETPGFIITVNGEKQNIYEFFDDDVIKTFEGEISYDT